MANGTLYLSARFCRAKGQSYLLDWHDVNREPAIESSW
jgi:hypothetical protein